MQATDTREPAWVNEVLGFWFVELGPESWFARSDALDETIRSRFLALHETLASTEAASFDHATPRTLLAAVVVLDQFSRNMFRGSARAFASDAIARRLARGALHRQAHRSLAAEQRFFLYLPFEHSEDRADQALAVELITELGNADWTKYALAHQAIIDRFGRFPHRNECLGRDSTPEERQLLADPMGSF